MINITVTPTPKPPRELVIQRVSCIDSSVAKTVEAEIQDVNTGALARVLLWSGTEYDAIGNWTDAQADARLEAILTEQKLREIFGI